MAVLVVCGVLVLLGLAAAVRWGGYEVAEPSAGPAQPVLRRYVSSVAVAVVSGLGAGIVIAGAGGRLAMRLLAVTAGDEAQGRITEAEEVVGRITVGGTVGFIVFTALFFGFATGALYLLVRRFLPPGRSSSCRARPRCGRRSGPGPGCWPGGWCWWGRPSWECPGSCLP